jgi:GNAT superfamily N-acetyltransferase
VTWTVRSLEPATWPLFAELVERNNGVYGGCWCIGWHLERAKQGGDYRAMKEERVRTGRAHAALVLDDAGVAQGWCQYGPPAELPGIKFRREYLADAPPVPDWRIACVFVDRRSRGRGVARAGVEGALERIAQAGGGLVEVISETTADREAQGRFLFSGTAELFEDLGFARVRQVGKHAWILGRTVEPA